MINTEVNEIANNISPAVNTGEPVIIINNLQKSFGNQMVLKDVSLKLFNGENLVVLGKSGSGKSVLIKCIVGLLYPDNGMISVFGKKETNFLPQFGKLSCF